MNRFGLLHLSVTALPACLAFAACSSGTTNTTSGGAPSVDAGTSDAPVTDAPASGTSCSKARDDLLLPIDRVSTGEVTVVSDSNGVKTLYVDASAGGLGGASLKNPRVYIDLEAGKKVDVTDKSAVTSTAWDLALKRSIIFTNGGDAGAGQGGAVQVAKAFGSVTAADETGLQKEKFFDQDCNPQLDPTGAPRTTFADWYDYDQVTNIPTPKPNVSYVVVSGTGKKYKVGIEAYDGAPDGGKGKATGVYVLRVSAL
jgi:hypothetical protein